MSRHTSAHTSAYSSMCMHDYACIHARVTTHPWPSRRRSARRSTPTRWHPTSPVCRHVHSHVHRHVQPVVIRPLFCRCTVDLLSTTGYAPSIQMPRAGSPPSVLNRLGKSGTTSATPKRSTKTIRRSRWWYGFSARIMLRVGLANLSLAASSGGRSLTKAYRGWEGSYAGCANPQGPPLPTVIGTTRAIR